MGGSCLCGHSIACVAISTRACISGQFALTHTSWRAHCWTKAAQVPPWGPRMERWTRGRAGGVKGWKCKREEMRLRASCWGANASPLCRSRWGSTGAQHNEQLTAKTARLKEPRINVFFGIFRYYQFVRSAVKANASRSDGVGGGGAGGRKTRREEASFPRSVCQDLAKGKEPSVEAVTIHSPLEPLSLLFICPAQKEKQRRRKGGKEFAWQGREMEVETRRWLQKLRWGNLASVSRQREIRHLRETGQFQHWNG